MLLAVPAPSPDHLVGAVCSDDKPHKCPPYGVCYGRYHYCSAASKNAEPCVSETVLDDLDSRKKMCQDIAKGKNITELVRDSACNLKADCFGEFETLLYPSTEDDATCSGTCVLAICLGIAFAIAVIAAVTLAILYSRKKAKENRNPEKEEMIDNRNADPGPNDTGSDREPMPPVTCDGDGAANARNPPNSGRAPDPTVTEININVITTTNASSLSASYTDSNQSYNSFPYIDEEKKED